MKRLITISLLIVLVTSSIADGFSDRNDSFPSFPDGFHARILTMEEEELVTVIAISPIVSTYQSNEGVVVLAQKS